jgi:hypothetical protein
MLWFYCYKIYQENTNMPLPQTNQALSKVLSTALGINCIATNLVEIKEDKKLVNKPGCFRVDFLPNRSFPQIQNYVNSLYEKGIIEVKAIDAVYAESLPNEVLLPAYLTVNATSESIIEKLDGKKTTIAESTSNNPTSFFHQTSQTEPNESSQPTQTLHH